MTREEIVQAVQNITEGRITQLNVEAWLEIELSRIVNRKHYWWRRKNYTFNSVAGTATYNLAVDGTAPLNIADDFYQSSKLYRWVSNTERVKIEWEGDASNILGMVYDTTQGEPKIHTVEPGTTKVIRLGPVPNAVAQYVGLYYAGVNTKWSNPTDAIPLVPPEHHYVVLFAMVRRAFDYLYGQEDVRYVNAVRDEKEALVELDHYDAPSVEHAVAWRSSDPTSFVRSTS